MRWQWAFLAFIAILTLEGIRVYACDGQKPQNPVAAIDRGIPAYSAEDNGFMRGSEVGADSCAFLFPSAQYTLSVAPEAEEWFIALTGALTETTRQLGIPSETFVLQHASAMDAAVRRARLIHGDVLVDLEPRFVIGGPDKDTLAAFMPHWDSHCVIVGGVLRLPPIGRVDEALRGAALRHELGHVLALGHDINPTSIMYHEVRTLWSSSNDGRTFTAQDGVLIRKLLLVQP